MSSIFRIKSFKKIKNIQKSEKTFMDSVKQQLLYMRNIRIFRNNVGTAAAYDFKKKGLSSPVKFIKYGLGIGTSDLIGYKKIIITQDMVGKTIAQFLAIETKKSAKSVKSAEQIEFINETNKNGGLAFFCCCEKDLELLGG